ncbi:hypothetical protein J5Y04_35910 [Kitasatospora sp. RG8]|uniref:hypothetical protein n=1 Tax=Kitasatospora sp. RG8 TaxID=2820815 RepID=UPI001ADFF12A|nr:hypothetical protein [Kitasatospora sp. RG8]MBP0454865.1 hypothetical protein [Kitasatospora sp. RG8]
MNRTIPALSTVAALAVLGMTVAAAPAAAAAPATVASAPTCGPSVRMINRLNTVCVTVDGPSVRVYGVSTQLAPGSGRSFIYKVSATVGGESLGTESGSAYFGSGTAYVGGPSGVVPCGSTVRASFSLTDFGTPPPTSVVDVAVTC